MVQRKMRDCSYAGGSQGSVQDILTEDTFELPIKILKRKNDNPKSTRAILISQSALLSSKERISLFVMPTLGSFRISRAQKYRPTLPQQKRVVIGHKNTQPEKATDFIG